MRRVILPGLFLLLALVVPSAAQSPNPRNSSSAFGGPTVYSAATVKDFLTACRTDRAGCTDAVGSALMNKMSFDGSADICLQSADYGLAVPPWLAAHPQMAAMETESGILAALKALYPC